MKNQPVGVVLLNMGGPESEPEIPVFLEQLLSDPEMVPLPSLLRRGLARFVSRRRAPKVALRYRAIGGKSPIGDETRLQAGALGRALGNGFRAGYAFRYSSPRAKRALAEMSYAGVKRVVALPAYPQWSRATVGSSVADFGVAARAIGIEWCEAPPYPEGEGLIEALADRLEPVLSEGTYVLMTAHGLPERFVKKGDPYPDQVKKTASRLAERLPNGTRWSLAFQSRLGPVKWLEPNLSEEIPRLGREGVRSLTVVPLTFACENLETLYDLDIDAAEQARSWGIRSYRRAGTPGCHRAFIDELARLARTTADKVGWTAEKSGWRDDSGS